MYDTKFIREWIHGVLPLLEQMEQKQRKEMWLVVCGVSTRTLDQLKIEWAAHHFSASYRSFDNTIEAAPEQASKKLAPQETPKTPAPEQAPKTPAPENTPSKTPAPEQAPKMPTPENTRENTPENMPKPIPAGPPSLNRASTLTRDEEEKSRSPELQELIQAVRMERLLTQAKLRRDRWEEYVAANWEDFLDAKGLPILDAEGRPIDALAPETFGLEGVKFRISVCVLTICSLAELVPLLVSPAHFSFGRVQRVRDKSHQRAWPPQRFINNT